LSCFDTASLSREDRERGSLYSAERDRKAELRQVGSVDDWLKSLEMRITLEPLGPADLPRATQLLNKTNQMNLTTRRLSEAEFWAWTQNPRRRCWTVRVEDRFGSAGLTGLLSVETDQNSLLIVDFVLSCRVFGRKVEESMLSLAVRHAREENLPKVVAMYRPTAKNKPCLDFFLRSGCRQEMDGSTFAWNTVEDHPFPAQVTVQLPDRLDAAP
jgi:FkbH-like protein